MLSEKTYKFELRPLELKESTLTSMLLNERPSYVLPNYEIQFHFCNNGFISVFKLLPVSDMISYTHVIVAAVAARFLNSESIFQKRIGVLLFEVLKTRFQLLQKIHS